jgi:hypothetical protein
MLGLPTDYLHFNRHYDLRKSQRDVVSTNARPLVTESASTKTLFTEFPARNATISILAAR